LEALSPRGATVSNNGKDVWWCILSNLEPSATGWTIQVLGLDSRQGLGTYLFPTAYRTALRFTQPPIQWVPWALSLGIKWPGVNLTTHLHLVPRSKNAWSYTTTPPIHLHGGVFSLKKHRDNFTLTFITEGKDRFILITALYSNSHQCLRTTQFLTLNATNRSLVLRSSTLCY
jgi:hypothetical protein